jgi:FkbM family methyltransferase
MSHQPLNDFLLINTETVLELMEGAKRLAKKRALQEYFSYLESARRKKSFTYFLRRVAGKIITTGLSSLGFELNTSNTKNKYVITNDEKSWSLDFLLYVIKRRPELEIKLFNEKDWQEVIKFVRNKIYTALFSELYVNDLFDEYDVRFWKAYNAFLRRISFRQGCYVLQHSGKEYRLPVNHFEYPVFFHKLGLLEVPSRVLAQVRGKDVIDGGAYVGDSALVLEELEPRTIYAFEPLEENFALLNRTIRINGLRNVVPLKMGLGAAKGMMSITLLGSASFRSDIFEGSTGARVETTTIDDFVAERGAASGSSSSMSRARSSMCC